MNATTARFSIQRQDPVTGGWRPLTSCNSLEYAKMIAAAGHRRRLGAYRLVHTRTGKSIELLPTAITKAACR